MVYASHVLLKVGLHYAYTAFCANFHLNLLLPLVYQLLVLATHMVLINIGTDS